MSFPVTSTLGGKLQHSKHWYEIQGRWKKNFECTKAHAGVVPVKLSLLTALLILLSGGGILEVLQVPLDTNSSTTNGLSTTGWGENTCFGLSQTKL